MGQTLPGNERKGYDEGAEQRVQARLPRPLRPGMSACTPLPDLRAVARGGDDRGEATLIADLLHTNSGAFERARGQLCGDEHHRLGRAVAPSKFGGSACRLRAESRPQPVEHGRACADHCASADRVRVDCARTTRDSQTRHAGEREKNGSSSGQVVPDTCPIRARSGPEKCPLGSRDVPERRARRRPSPTSRRSDFLSNGGFGPWRGERWTGERGGRSPR